MVVLYSTGCPKCNVLETKLRQLGVDFELVDDADVMVEKGFLSAPMLEVDGVAMDFSGALNWIRARE